MFIFDLQKWGGKSPDFWLPAAFGGRFKHEMLKLPYKKVGGGKTRRPQKWGGRPPHPPHLGGKNKHWWGVGGSPEPKPGFDAKLGIWGGFGANTHSSPHAKILIDLAAQTGQTCWKIRFSTFTRHQILKFPPCGSINHIFYLSIISVFTSRQISKFPLPGRGAGSRISMTLSINDKTRKILTP